MATYYEDHYIKHECADCKRCFIVGEALSLGMSLVCPYCQSKNIEMIASSDDCSDDMGCLGLHYHRYQDGRLMLRTEREFAHVISCAMEAAGDQGLPLLAVNNILHEYCARRDGRIETE